MLVNTIVSNRALAKQIEIKFNTVMTLLNFLILTFSPLMGMMFSCLYLLTFSNYISKNVRLINVSILILNMSLIIASRLYFETESDDFIRYYKTYQTLLSGDYSAIFAYSNGLEWVLPLFYALLAIVFNNDSPIFLLFSETLLILIIFYCWIESYFKDKTTNKELNQLIATAFLFFSLGMATQVTRQFLAMVILLHSFSNQGGKRYFFLMLATFTHLVALPLFILIRFVQRNPKLYGILVLFASIAMVQLMPLILMHVDFDLPLLSKLGYYLHALNNDVEYSFVRFFFMIVISIGIYIHKPIGFIKEWRNVFLVFTFMFLIFLPIPLASVRLTLLVFSILLGVFFFFSFKQYGVLYPIVISAYILYRLYSWTKIDLANEMHLWGSYSWIGRPFYYLIGF